MACAHCAALQEIYNIKRTATGVHSVTCVDIFIWGTYKCISHAIITLHIHLTLPKTQQMDSGGFKTQ